MDDGGRGKGRVVEVVLGVLDEAVDGGRGEAVAEKEGAECGEEQLVVHPLELAGGEEVGICGRIGNDSGWEMYKYLVARNRRGYFHLGR